MRITDYPSVEFVRQSLRYEGGKLFWRKRPKEHFRSEANQKTWNSRYAGKEAGYIRTAKLDRRVAIYLGNGLRYRSTLTWVIFHGFWPVEVDHIDTNPLNDFIDNLRLCTTSQNRANSRRHSRNKCGYKGVSFNKALLKYQASICVNYKRYHLGLYSTAEEAHEVYVKAAREHFGEFARSG